MNSYESKFCLQHFGIPGMKWGRRRYQNADGSLTAEGKRRYQNTQSKESRKDLVNRRRYASDKELKAAIERLKTERQLKELTDADLNPGRAAISDAVAKGGKRALTTIATGTALYAVKKVIDAKMGPGASSYITPRPKFK